MPSISMEYIVIRNYLDILLDLPWETAPDTTSFIDLKMAKAQLNKDHLGLVKVKRRILEFLAVTSLQRSRGGGKSIKGPILLLVGPPVRLFPNSSLSYIYKGYRQVKNGRIGRQDSWTRLSSYQPWRSPGRVVDPWASTYVCGCASWTFSPRFKG